MGDKVPFQGFLRVNYLTFHNPGSRIMMMMRGIIIKMMKNFNDYGGTNLQFQMPSLIISTTLGITKV